MKKFFIVIGILAFGFYLFYIFHVHDFKLVAHDDETCTEYGHTVYKCWCGETEKETIDPLGHDLEVSTIAPTCTTPNVTVYRCKRCGYEKQEEGTEYLPHDYEESIDYEQGVMRYVCKNCGRSYIQDLSKTDLLSDTIKIPQKTEKVEDKVEEVEEPVQEPKQDEIIEDVKEDETIKKHGSSLPIKSEETPKESENISGRASLLDI